MPGGTALSIGNFDGVHLGHLALVRAARTEVGPGGRVVVLSFDPHPLAVLRPQGAPAALGSIEERRQLLREAGVDDVLFVEPTREFLSQSPEAFLEEIVARVRPHVLVEGPDFRFGRGRAGSVATLEVCGRELGFAVRVIEPVEMVLRDGTLVRCGSTVIRWLIERGRVADAACLLGRPYALSRPVVPGERRGRDLGVPTANLADGATLVPADGIYAGRADAPDGRTYPAAISVGTKPTFGNHPRICEAHLIGFAGPPGEYAWTMRLEFLEWLRDQITCDSIEALVDQIRRDIAVTVAVVDGLEGAAGCCGGRRSAAPSGRERTARCPSHSSM